MRNLIIATNNRGKLIEISALLADLELRLHTPTELGLNLEVTEDGASYAENATKKALAFTQASGMVALGDDSGLEVDALGGQPGIQSHRFSPTPGATDEDRRKYLLSKLLDCPQPWTARFKAAIAVATPSGQLQLAEGRCEGIIIPDERGSNGFGYDPIFFIPELGHTMAELPLTVKNSLSHRARAVNNAIPILKDLFNTP